ncbi:putative Ran-binding protein [Blattamonas nauphoetae]|uniref:Ran-binding protein n=1 Tax=Blattamonas nauphoetae TaxID=2049346 RepID=A0ABQ9YBX2_9EUKA|nr:putative Ran-binding protein [Blattamonas nauphoetae]
MNPTEILQLEQYTTVYFTSHDSSMRLESQSWLDEISTRDNLIEICSNVITNSQNPYALLFCCDTIRRYFSEQWSTVPLEQRTGFRTFLHQYLINSGPLIIDAAYSNVSPLTRGNSTPPLITATQSICKLYARVLKLGWSVDGDDMSADTFGEFFSDNLSLSLVGLEVLYEVLFEVCYNQEKAFTATEHRKCQVNYRTTCLLGSVTIAHQCLSSYIQRAYANMNPSQQHRILSRSLHLALMCWSFDFIGTNPSAAADDNASVHIPATWQPIFEDPATLLLYFDLYDQLPDYPDERKRTLEILCQLAAVRRTAFTSDDSRLLFLHSMMEHLNTIMKKSDWQQDTEIFHQLCRLVFKLKVTFTNQELETAVCYSDFISNVNHMTIKVFQNWQSSSNATFYLLSFWSRMVQTAPRGNAHYSRSTMSFRPIDGSGQVSSLISSNAGNNGASDTPHLDVTWEALIPDVAKEFIDSKLQLSQKIVEQQSNEDPFDKEDLIMQQMLSIAFLIRFSYSSLCGYLVQVMDPLLEKYAHMQQLALADKSEETLNPLELIETQLAWLLYLIGGTVTARKMSSYKPDLDQYDGLLSAKALCVLRTNAMGPNLTPGTKRLVMAQLYFMSQYSRSFIIENVNFCAVVTEKISSIAGLKNAQDILTFFVDSAFSMLKNWPDEEELLKQCLGFLKDVQTGYNGSKLIQNVESVGIVLQSHTVEQFEFLRNPSDLHVIYYGFVSSLLFTETRFDMFPTFIDPFIQNLTFLSQKSAEALASPEFENPLVSLFQDLRGVVQSCVIALHFEQLFSELRPFFDTFVRIAMAWINSSLVFCSFLKLWIELSLNRSLRHSHNQNSANAVHLFRTTAQVITSSSDHFILPSLPAFLAPEELFTRTYQPMSYLLKLLFNTLEGSYVPFGVCRYYNDSSLEDSVERALAMIISVPRRHFLAFPKLAKRSIRFLNSIFRAEIQTVLSVKTDVLFQVFERVEDALTSYNTILARSALEIIDSIFTYAFNHRERQDAALSNFFEVESQHPEFFGGLMSTMFSQVIKDEELQSYAPFPLFAMIKVHPELYQNFIQSISQSLPESESSIFQFQFGTQLLEGIPDSIQARNRDRFNINIHQLKKDWMRLLPS